MARRETTAGTPPKLFRFWHRMELFNISTSGVHFTAAFFVLFALFEAINSLGLGLGYRTDSYLFTPQDLFADFIKFSFSLYPDAKYVLSDGFFISKQHLEYYQNGTHYIAGAWSIDDYRTPVYVLPPMSFLFSVSSANAMQAIDSTSFFLLLFTVLVALFYLVAAKIAGRILFILLLAMLISYPILFAFTRGHIHSLLHVVFLSASCYFLLVERKYLLAAFFLAAAVNIRPNALIMIAALPFGTAKVQFKYVGATVAFSASLFAFSLLALSLLYSDYSLHRFFQAVTFYHEVFVQAPRGSVSQYSSSLLSLFKNIGGSYSKSVELAFAGLFCLLALVFAFLQIRGVIPAGLAWIGVLFAYNGASSVFADYYLVMYWLIVAVVIAHVNNQEGLTRLPLTNLILWSCLLLLIPKSLFFLDSHFNAIANGAIVVGVSLCLTGYGILKLIRLNDV